jgi:TonB family protein
MKRTLLIVMIILGAAACSKEGGGVGSGGDSGGSPEPRAAAVVVKRDAFVRTAGEPQIQPDEDTAKAMVASGRSRVITSWKVCVDPQGEVDEIAPQRSSGFMTYDAAILAGIKEWRFQPVVVDGAPVRACTSFTFAWSPG